jgi:hypothetical protein
VGAGLGRAVGSAAALATQVAPTLSNSDANARTVEALTSLGLSRPEAKRMVDEARQAMKPKTGAGAAQSPLEPKEAASEAADKTAAAGAAASWVGFGIALLSLLGGAWGGMLGAISEQKVLGELARKREEAQRTALPPSGPITTPGA